MAAIESRVASSSFGLDHMDSGFSTINDEVLGSSFSMTTGGDSSRTTGIRRHPRALYSGGGIPSPRDSSPTGSVMSSATYGARHRRMSMDISTSLSASTELSSKAESEFFELTGLISQMSQRSNSLKDIWAKLSYDREACYNNLNRMTEYVNQADERIERRNTKIRSLIQIEREHVRKIESIEQNLVEAHGQVTSFKSRLSEKDGEYRQLTSDMSKLRDKYNQADMDLQKMRLEFEQTRNSLKISESSRAQLDSKYKQLRDERDVMSRDHINLVSRWEELTSKYHNLEEEMKSKNSTIKSLQSEQKAWTLRESELQETIRTHEVRIEEAGNDYRDLQHKHQEQHLSIKSLKETIHQHMDIVTRSNNEKTELEKKIKTLEITLREARDSRNKTDTNTGELRRKLDQSESENRSLIDDKRQTQIKIQSLNDTISGKTREYRELISEKKRIEEELRITRGRNEEDHGELEILREARKRADNLLLKTQEDNRSKTKLIEQLQAEVASFHSTSKTHKSDIQTYESRISGLNNDVTTLRKRYSTLQEEYERKEAELELVTEHVRDLEVSSRDGFNDMSSWNKRLEDMRRHIDQANEMRLTADRQRDDALTRYERVSRELSGLKTQISDSVVHHGRRSSLQYDGHMGSSLSRKSSGFGLEHSSSGSSSRKGSHDKRDYSSSSILRDFSSSHHDASSSSLTNGNSSHVTFENIVESPIS